MAKLCLYEDNKRYTGRIRADYHCERVEEKMQALAFELA